MLNTQAMIGNFERDGLVLLEGLLDERQIDEARQAVEWAMEQPPAPYKWIRQRTYEWFREHPIFLEVIEYPLVIEFATAWLGPDFHLIAAQCSRNTREDHYAPGAMKIHPDACFFPAPERRQPEVPDHRCGFSAMWYLQDTPLEMGPTELIPGSHIRTQTYQDEELDPTMLFRQAIPAGSLLVFNHRTWHRGALNHTDQPRDLITNAYARREVDKVQLTTPQADGSQRYVPCRDLIASSNPILRQLLEDDSPLSQSPLVQ